MVGTSRGSIAFFATYRPPVPLDIFSCPVDPPPSSDKDEVRLTDGLSYNQNGRPFPAAALKELLMFLGKNNPKLASECGVSPDDADKGHVTGLLFVSEREGGLETLQVALCRTKVDVKVLSLAEIYGASTFGGVRMEDSPCIAGGFTEGDHAVGYSLVYVSTKEPAQERRTPWTAVYKTRLVDGRTERLTLPDQCDLSPAVSPSGKMVAAASFRWNEWTGEIEKLNTDIVVMNTDKQAQGGLRRRVLIKDGGWPSWGSDNVIFFHRGVNSGTGGETNWGVFRYEISTDKTIRMSPAKLDAMTPAAISESKVAVATVRRKSGIAEVRSIDAQYRHIEILDIHNLGNQVHVTKEMRGEGDHYSPFVLDGGSRIGYHRCISDKLLLQSGGVARHFQKLQSPPSHKEVGLFRVSGVFPTISKDGSKLAFVDNEFRAVWLADSQGLSVIYERRDPNSVCSTAWNQNPDKDTLYVCVGPSFAAGKALEIYAISNVSGPPGAGGQYVRRLTYKGFNNAFPSSNPEGTKLVFRSTCDRSGGLRKNKNLYLMEDVDDGEYGKVTRLTNGAWNDTHCSWSPRGDWIVFSSSRDRPSSAPEKAFLDAGYFAVYLVRASDPAVVVRVVQSSATVAGHVNHPVFSPDTKSIVFTSDLAAVSAEPISMPHFVHSVRPYGDIFSVDLRDTRDITKNRDIREFHRITHSRYEYSTPVWTRFATDDPNAQWSKLVDKDSATSRPACPYAH